MRKTRPERPTITQLAKHANRAFSTVKNWHLDRKFDINSPTVMDDVRALADKHEERFRTLTAHPILREVIAVIDREKEKKGLSNRDITDKAGVDRNTITRIRRARSDVRFSSIEYLLNVVGYKIAIVPVDEGGRAENRESEDDAQVQ